MTDTDTPESAVPAGPPDRLIVRVERVDGRSIVQLIGEADMSTTGLLRENIEPLNGDVLLDLAWLSFLDSSGISALIAQRRRLESDGGSFRLRRAPDNVRHVLSIVGLEDWLDD